MELEELKEEKEMMGLNPNLRKFGNTWYNMSMLVSIKEVHTHSMSGDYSGTYRESYKEYIFVDGTSFKVSV